MSWEPLRGSLEPIGATEGPGLGFSGAPAVEAALEPQAPDGVLGAAFLGALGQPSRTLWESGWCGASPLGALGSGVHVTVVRGGGGQGEGVSLLRVVV